MIEALTKEWKQAKAAEEQAKNVRIAIESQIYEQVQKELPEKGTKSFDTGLKITTGFTESWDQEVLNRAYQAWPATHKFPFHGVWEADGKAVTYIRENQPELYALIREGLTLRPRKPSFSVKEGV